MSLDFSTIVTILIVIMALQPLIMGRWSGMQRAQAIRAVEKAHGTRVITMIHRQEKRSHAGRAAHRKDEPNALARGRGRLDDARFAQVAVRVLGRGIFGDQSAVDDEIRVALVGLEDGHLEAGRVVEARRLRLDRQEPDDLAARVRVVRRLALVGNLEQDGNCRLSGGLQIYYGA